MVTPAMADARKISADEKTGDEERCSLWWWRKRSARDLKKKKELQPDALPMIFGARPRYKEAIGRGLARTVRAMARVDGRMDDVVDWKTEGKSEDNYY